MGHRASSSTFQYTELLDTNDQDADIIGIPKKSLFREDREKYGPCARRTIIHNLEGKVGFKGRIACKADKYAHFLQRVVVVADMPALESTVGSGTGIKWCKDIGYHLINAAYLYIDDKEVQKITNHWLVIFRDITLRTDDTYTENNLIGNTEDLTEFSATKIGRRVYILIPYFFSRHPSLALPLVAGKESKVEIKIEIKALEELYILDTGSSILGGDAKKPQLEQVRLYLDYLRVDDGQINVFIKQPLKYIIEQVQSTEIQCNGIDYNIILPFNFPIKCIFWTAQLTSFIENGANQHSNYTDASDYLGNNLIDEAGIFVGKEEIIPMQKAEFFAILEPRKFSIKSPITGLNMYSFAVCPLDIEPSGTLNASASKDVILRLRLKSSAQTTVRIFAWSFNVMTAKNGQLFVKWLT